jgi:hypothetical protein
VLVYNHADQRVVLQTIEVDHGAVEGATDRVILQCSKLTGTLDHVFPM